MSYLEDETPGGIKIVFTGLDNAGKTSIILSLLREFSKFAIIKPTKGAQRRIYEFLDMHVSEWDLGGQEKYRITYLKDPDFYFERTEIMIYVVDIQNPDRISVSLNYLDNIIAQFKNLQIEPFVYIFFHKLDPDIYEKDKDEINNIILNIKSYIEKNMYYEKYQFYETSIFNLTTIINAMSEILLSRYPKSHIIKDLVDEFAKKINAEGLEITDDNSFIISSYYKDNFIKLLLNSSTPYFLQVNDTFEKIKVEACQPEDQMLVHRFGKYFLFKKFKLRKEGSFYYILVCKESSEFNEQEYNAFIDLLKKFLVK